MFGFGKKDRFPFGFPGLEFPPGAELEHTLIPATTGTGKSQLINLLLNRILEGITARPDLEKALITDPDGQFLMARGAAGDHVLNPADRRSLQWNPFSEIRTEFDYQLLASAAIPADASSGKDEEFRLYAQTMLSALMKGLQREGKADPREVQRLASADVEALSPYLVGTPAEALLRPGNDRFLGSVLGTLGQGIKAWDFLSPDGDFSIRDWVQKGKGVLFLTYTAAQIEALRPLVGCWLSLAIKEALSLPVVLNARGVSDRRVWFVTDELDSLGTVNGLSDALTRGRKYGLAVVSAIQSIPQLRIRYGKDGAAALEACYVNKLIMRQGDFEDAKHWSDYLGQSETERIERSENYSRGPGGSSGGSVHAKRSVDQLVLPSELSDLPKFCGYARVSGLPGIRTFKFQPQSWPKRVEPFLPKETQND